jgi:uroporphyrinogen III methyltransferase / synthase
VRVVVTRAPGQAEPLASRLEELGHEVVPCPLIRIDRIGGDPVELSSYDWVIVTSPNGAEELLNRARGRPTRLAAIGPGTTAALLHRGIAPDLVPHVSTQEGLLAELPRPAGRVLFAAAEGARMAIVQELGADFLPLYRTVELRPEPPEGDLVVLASASAARAFGAIGAGLPAVSIGPQTSRAAREHGIRVIAEADPHDLGGLVDAVARLGST